MTWRCRFSPRAIPAGTARLAAALLDAIALRARRARDEALAIPSTLLIAVNSHCNLRCPTCTVGDTVALPDHHLAPATLRALISEALPLGIANFVLLGGEPLLYPGLEEVISAFPGALFNVFSNGRLLDDDPGAPVTLLSPNFALYLNVGSTNRRGSVDRLDRGVLRALATAERHHLLHGAAITISADNAPLFAARATLDTLRNAGSRFALFLDYLPAIGIPQDRFSTPPAAARRCGGQRPCLRRRAELLLPPGPRGRGAVRGLHGRQPGDPVRQRLRHHRSLPVRPVLEPALPRDHAGGRPCDRRS